MGQWRGHEPGLPSVLPVLTGRPDAWWCNTSPTAGEACARNSALVEIPPPHCGRQVLEGGRIIQVHRLSAHPT
jgi:hypothetical protein